MTEKLASEIIREMKCTLFERGHHRGALEGADGSVCILGAHNVAQGRLASDEDYAYNSALASPAVRACARAAGVTGGITLFLWQDDTKRSFDEVIETLDAAEKLALIAEESA